MTSRLYAGDTYKVDCRSSACAAGVWTSALDVVCPHKDSQLYSTESEGSRQGLLVLVGRTASHQPLGNKWE